jgi:N-acetylglucosaminyldiphosphoundecaprenol N-acetyl-beta-D-mannosaminyltransferase
MDALNTDKILICGIPIDSVTMDEAILRIGQLIDERKPAYVVTPNVDVIVKLQKDSEFKLIYEKASLVLADGMPLLWAGMFLGTPFKAKVSGSDLFIELCVASAKKGYKIFLLGAKPTVAEKASLLLRQKYPNLKIVGTYSPSFGFEKNEKESAEIVKIIREQKPDIIFVGVGSPKQEKWISSYMDRYNVPVSIGVGISFDFVAGTVKRAPKIMQKTGLEWLWRLFNEPGRLWKRYLLDDPVFFWLLLRQKLKNRRHNEKKSQCDFRKE